MAKQKDCKEDGVQVLRLPRLLWDSRQIPKLFGLTFQIYEMRVKERSYHTGYRSVPKFIMYCYVAITPNFDDF